MAQLFYRFRNINSLLGFEELQKQTIYFAPPEDLNDPMEGFRNLIWSGDTIAWKNLFKHYLMCLERVSSLLILCGEEHHTLKEGDLPIYNSYDHFPTPQYKKLFETIATDFFDLSINVIEKIATRTTPVKRYELQIYLTLIHLTAIEVIQKNYELCGFIPKREFSHTHISDTLAQIIIMIDTVEKMLQEAQGYQQVEDIFDMFKNFQDNITLRNKCEGTFCQDFPNRNFVLVDFPEKYLNEIEKLLYPQWYTACFMTESHSSSVWGHYGDGHKGVCLIFQSEHSENGDFIRLKGKVGWGSEGAIMGDRNHPFYQVNYEDGFEEIDFFKYIGSLPAHQLLSMWYTDEDKTLSKAADSYISNEEKWRQQYWNIYQRDILIKTKDWAYEKEYRLILNGLLEHDISKEHRLLTYDFKSLKGIIFGIKTSTEDKLKIIDIIRNKCKQHNRNDFEFYQAYYSSKDKNIQHRKMAFL
ncbi:DUF2971 domain-containing protein [Sulfuricurvum sp. IAE1]|uniref:DUF2971 domain-containing protein n=1 Tax=Sulfuricurvum sp. IAE1 TaxID=2546102 RepID=UPI00104474BC|nr:DUF2971 domain-containing protein [Sulfuricurvum sp. IAE1]TDA69666.1 DUF2971 domain-containing protein [Sulfuricurvum sp. IAE1]